MLLSPTYESSRFQPISYLTRHLKFRHTRRSSDATFTNSGFWGKTSKRGGRDDKAAQQAQMALTRQRLVTLVYDDMETVRMVRNTPFSLACSSLIRSDSFQVHSRYVIGLSIAVGDLMLNHAPQDLEVLARDWVKPLQLLTSLSEYQSNTHHFKQLATSMALTYG